MTNVCEKSSMLMISQVQSLGQHLTTLLDSGANMSLITKDAVSQLDLKGDIVTSSITKAGNLTETMESVK